MAIETWELDANWIKQCRSGIPIVKRLSRLEHVSFKLSINDSSDLLFPFLTGMLEYATKL